MPKTKTTTKKPRTKTTRPAGADQITIKVRTTTHQAIILSKGRYITSTGDDTNNADHIDRLIAAGIAALDKKNK
jgi:hypothetical protein